MEHAGVVAGLVPADAILLLQDDDAAVGETLAEAVRGREADDSPADHEERHGSGTVHCI